jgi:hypothetical protein
LLGRDELCSKIANAIEWLPARKIKHPRAKAALNFGGHGFGAGIAGNPEVKSGGYARCFLRRRGGWCESGFVVRPGYPPLRSVGEIPMSSRILRASSEYEVLPFKM